MQIYMPGQSQRFTISSDSELQYPLPTLFENFLIRPHFIFLCTNQGVVKEYYADKQLQGWEYQNVVGQSLLKNISTDIKRACLKSYRLSNYTQKPSPVEFVYTHHKESYCFEGFVYPAMQPSGDVVVVLNDVTEKRKQATELEEKTQSLSDFTGYLKQIHRIQTTYYVNSDALFSDYIKTGCRIFKMSNGFITKVSGQKLMLKSMHSDAEWADKLIDQRIEDRLCEMVVQQKDTICYDSQHQWLQNDATSLLGTSYQLFIGTPIFVESKVYGTLSFFATEERQKTIQPYEIELIELMSRSLGRYLEDRVNDIRKERIENTLKESEEKYRTVIENLSEVIFKTDRNGVLTFLNNAWEDVLGYSVSESIGRSFSAYVIEEDLELNTMHFDAMLEMNKGYQTYEVRCKTKKGETRWLSAHLKFNLEYGELTGIVGTLNDITEKKNIEINLQKSEERYRSLLDATFEGIIVHDHRQILDANMAFARMMHYDISELPGMKLMDLVGTDSDKKTIVKKIVIRDATPFETKGLRKNGSIIDLEVITKRHTYQGRVVRLTALRDITARKRAEQELQQAREMAEASIRAKEQFLTMMTHELRTPLNTVVGMTHLLLDENPLPSQVEYMEAIKFSADNLLALINDMLDFSKIESGKITFESADFSLRHLLKGIRQSLLLKAEEKNIQVLIQLDIEVPDMLRGDVMRLNQVLTNLLSNAVKFTEEGSVVISVYQVDEDDTSHTLRFEVKDTGIGIPEDRLDAIFESYQQASPDISRKYGGTGLGLTITRKLIELQGGTIMVRSALGKGSTFTFTLPFERQAIIADTEQKTEAKAQAYDELNSLRLLLVEDNKFNQLIAMKFLSKWKIKVDVADGGYSALDMLEQNVYDLVLMDLQMPDLNGIDATKMIRSNPLKHINSVPVIAITAASFTEVKAKVFDAGMNDYISKPFNPNDLYLKLVRYAKKQPVLVEQAALPAEPAEVPLYKEEEALSDFSYVELLSDEKNEFMIQALEMFLIQMNDFAVKLKEIQQTKDVEMFKFYSHKMKSTYNTLKINAFKEIVKDFEHADKDSVNFDLVNVRIEQLARLNTKIGREIEAKLREIKRP